MALAERLTAYATEAEAERSLWSCARAADVRLAAEVVAAVEQYGRALRSDEWGYDVDAAWERVRDVADRLHAARGGGGT